MLGAPRAARAWRSEQIHASTFVCSVRCQLLVARNPVGTGSARSARVCPRSPFDGERRHVVGALLLGDRGRGQVYSGDHGE